MPLSCYPPAIIVAGVEYFEAFAARYDALMEYGKALAEDRANDQLRERFVATDGRTLGALAKFHRVCLEHNYDPIATLKLFQG